MSAEQPAPELAAAMAESRAYREALARVQLILFDATSDLAARREALKAASRALEGK